MGSSSTFLYAYFLQREYVLGRIGNAMLIGLYSSTKNARVELTTTETGSSSSYILYLLIIRKYPDRSSITESMHAFMMRSSRRKLGHQEARCSLFYPWKSSSRMRSASYRIGWHIFRFCEPSRKNLAGCLNTVQKECSRQKVCFPHNLVLLCYLFCTSPQYNWPMKCWDCSSLRSDLPRRCWLWSTCCPYSHFSPFCWNFPRPGWVRMLQMPEKGRRNGWNVGTNSRDARYWSDLLWWILREEAFPGKYQLWSCHRENIA